MHKKFLFPAIIALILFLSGCGSQLVGQNIPVPFAEKIAKKESVKDLSVDMLIFISPQYKDDIEIEGAINDYVAAVKNDIGWETKIVKLSSENNDFKKIDKIIEDEYIKTNGKIKASIMVGEDMNTPLKHDYDGNGGTDCPSTAPWSTIGEDAYSYPETGVQSYDKEMKIAVSLLYPAHNLDYQIKSKQLILVFEKFSKDRDKKIEKNINIFIAKDFPSEDRDVKKIFNLLCNFGNCSQTERTSPSQQVIEDTFNKEYMAYVVFGHANYYLVITGKEYFFDKYLDQINSPFIMIAGCDTDCWASGVEKDNNFLDYSNTSESKNVSWFSDRIMSSPNVRVMIIGEPGTAGKSFASEALPGFLLGKTIAESMINKTYSVGDLQQIIGDPTFHYNF